MTSPVKYTGDDIRFVATLRINNIPTNLSSGIAQIKCALVSQDRTEVIVGPVICDLLDISVDYGVGKVPVFFPKAITSVEPGTYFVEFSVIKGGEEVTWADASIELRKSAVV